MPEQNLLIIIIGILIVAVASAHVEIYFLKKRLGRIIKLMLSITLDVFKSTFDSSDDKSDKKEAK